MGAFLAPIQLGLRRPLLAVTAALTFWALWMDLGTTGSLLLSGDPGLTFDFQSTLALALAGPGNALSLPLLAALPAAAEALDELSCGAARMAVFRCGRPRYMFGQLIACLFLALLGQALGLILLSAALAALTVQGAEPFPWGPIAARMLAAGCFALIGGSGALLTGDSVNAYAVPTALSFTLVTLSDRFLPGVSYVHPLSWLAGGKVALVLLLFLLGAISGMYLTLLSREVKRYV
jgi:hypothetical protein